MSDTGTLKAGDKIVRYSRMWKVFKIKKQTNSDGKKDKIIYYRPVFPINKSGALSLCIPESKLKGTQIRRPIPVKTIVSSLKSLNRKPEQKKPINLIKIRENLEQDVFDTTIEVLRRLWWIKRKDVDAFTKSKESVFKLAIKKLSEEVAYAYGIPLTKAREKIRDYLKE